MHIGNGVRAAMALKRKGPTKVSEELSCSPQQVHNRLNQADWRMSEIERYAGAIGVTVDDVLEFARKA